MTTGSFAVLPVILVCASWIAPVASAQSKSAEGNAAAGRILAMRACTGCHLVAPDQPFKPVYAPPPHPPDFKKIASRSNVTAASLQRHLQTLSAFSANSEMPNLMLSTQEIRDVAASIVSLRDKPAAPSQ